MVIARSHVNFSLDKNDFWVGQIYELKKYIYLKATLVLFTAWYANGHEGDTKQIKRVHHVASQWSLFKEKCMVKFSINNLFLKMNRQSFLERKCLILISSCLTKKGKYLKTEPSQSLSRFKSAFCIILVRPPPPPP